MALTIAMVNAGDYLGRGNEYAVYLAYAVERNLNLPHEIVCFCDDPRDAPGIFRGRPLPHPGLKGWFNKLALFKPGVFQDGERVLYLDLDSVITGSLDDIASYDGEFACLEDLIWLGKLATGVMAWRGGFGAHVWQAYVDQDYPEPKKGDQDFLASVQPRCDLLQDLYPGQIASYKMSDKVLSPQTRVVAFHGTPRPHEVETGWVPKLWRPA